MLHPGTPWPDANGPMRFFNETVKICDVLRNKVIFNTFKCSFGNDIEELKEEHNVDYGRSHRAERSQGISCDHFMVHHPVTKVRPHPEIGYQLTDPSSRAEQLM